MNCPECGAPCDRDEVDIGVGVQCGPWGCFDCGWTESHPIVGFIEDTESSMIGDDPSDDDDSCTYGRRK